MHTHGLTLIQDIPIQDRVSCLGIPSQALNGSGRTSARGWIQPDANDEKDLLSAAFSL